MSDRGHGFRAAPSSVHGVAGGRPDRLRARARRRWARAALIEDKEFSSVASLTPIDAVAVLGVPPDQVLAARAMRAAARRVTNHERDVKRAMDTPRDTVGTSQTAARWLTCRKRVSEGAMRPAGDGKGAG